MNCTDYCKKKLNDEEKCSDSCFSSCTQLCTSKSHEDGGPPLPPEYLGDDQTNPSHVISTNLLIITCILGGVFLLGVFWMVSMKFYSRWRNFRRLNSPPIFNDTHEDFLDGNHGPVIDHPIWYIHTVGLQQSVIDSITMIRYKKDEGLIDGTECSVCLSEFQEDESLRLLPKCSHAFHLPCIDTWLRSHKNCPLCRAPIVRDAGGSGLVSTTESNLSDLSSRENEDPQVENLENHGGMLSHQHGEIGGNEVRARSEDLDASPMEIERISEILKKGLLYLDARNGEFRVQSDLVDNRRVAEEEPQVRRSVSLDSSSASVIYRAMANATELEEGSSNSHSAQVKNKNCGILTKRSSGGTSNLYKLMKSSSIGRSMQKRPVLMKRSFSSGVKLSVPRHSRSKTCILPL